MILPRNYYSRALVAGLVAGTLDITAACLQFYIKTGRGPLPVLKYIASGVFGKDAYTNNSIMPIMGLLFHFIIAISFAIIFFWLASRVPVLLNYKVLTAIGYGIFMWSVTQFIVIPLSRINPAPVKPLNALIAISILIICISIPLIYFAGISVKMTTS
jgi:hypothetical protein